MTPGERRFGGTTLFLMGSLLTWMANFLFVYVFAAVACARGFAAIEIAGMGVVPFATLLSSICGAVITLALLRFAATKLTRPGVDEHTRFIAFVVMATSIIALIAVLWLVLPVILTTACVPGGNTVASGDS